MNKEGKSRILFLAVFLGIFLIFVGFAFAAHIVTFSDGGTSLSIDEDVSTLINITVNNTDTGSAANISSVNISLPIGISFVEGTNDTDAGTHTFSTDGGNGVNTITILTWENDGLVLNSTVNHFWFNVTSPDPGVISIDIITTNSTGSESTSLNITVNDTTSPQVSFVSPVDSGNLSGEEVLNATITDNSSLGVVSFNVTNSSGEQDFISATNTSLTSWNATLNTSALADGDYNITVYSNDSAGNDNNSVFVSVTIDNTNPTISSFSCENVNQNADQDCTCVGADSGTGVASTSISDESTSSAGTNTATCTVTDYAGNSVASTADYTVRSSGGGSSTVDADWTKTYSAGNLESKGSVTYILSTKQRIKMSIGGNDHHVGVLEINGNEVTIEVSSDPQEEDIEEGESKKFDVDDDSIYDIEVFAEDVGSKATIRVDYIGDENLEVVSATGSVSDENVQGSGDASEVADVEDTNGSTSSSGVIWAIVIILLLGGAGFGVYWFKFKKKNINSDVK